MRPLFPDTRNSPDGNARVSAASGAMKSSGSKNTWVVPSRYTGAYKEIHRNLGILHVRVGKYLKELSDENAAEPPPKLVNCRLSHGAEKRG